jgi:hemolysin activation/secretion protein
MNSAAIMKNRYFKLAILLAAHGVQLEATAQQMPDAGQILQQQKPLSQPAPGKSIEFQAPVGKVTAPGGAQVPVQSIVFVGNTIFLKQELNTLLGDVTGKTYDLAGLRNLAERVTRFYWASGYPFARAFLAPQAMEGGQLKIEVLQGRYGSIQALGDPDDAKNAQRFLRNLKPGRPIQNQVLERTTLILDDLPGIDIKPLIRPGTEMGAGDLDVRIERTPLFTAELGVDNHGNRYTGANRARANLQWDSPFRFGDQLTIRSLYSDEAMWMGNINYSAPVGVSGLRANVGYSHTYYQLGLEFASAQASGVAKTTSAGLSYPVIRTQNANLNVGVGVMHKELADRKDAFNSVTEKSSNSLPVTLQFDVRDSLGGGAITYGTVGWTPGELMLADGLRAADDSTARTNGSFSKWSLDMARLQNMAPKWSTYARVSAQGASKNLDSSERFSLGGANGVRAYPQGEGFGDGGVLAQLELRHSVGAVSPFLFYDAGRVRLNASPWDAGINTRTLGGYGLGARWQSGPWSADASIAWRAQGGDSQADSLQRNPRVWVSVGRSY